MGVYRFCKSWVRNVWCYRYFWVATSPCGGFGGPPPRKCINMKCSRSDSRHILGLLRVSSKIKFSPYIYDIFLKKIDS